MIMTTSSQNNSENLKFSAMVYAKTITMHDGDVKLSDIFADNSSIKALESRLGHTFKDINILIQALAHQSYIHESTNKIATSYERLEFLGDSIVGAFITRKVYDLYPNFNEGNLSKLKSALVNEYSLARLGEFLELGDLILLGRGELDAPLGDGVLSDVLEAVIGAISKDSNITKSFDALEKTIANYQREMNQDFYAKEKIALFDPKSSLQELTMKMFKRLPKYDSVEVKEGFLVTLSICDVTLCEATSISKKEAMKTLAQKCLINNLINKVTNNTGESLC